MQLLMNVHMSQYATSNHYKVGRYVENVCPGIRLRLTTSLVTTTTFPLCFKAINIWLSGNMQ